MDYITTKDASNSWGISQRRISLLCAEGRIEGALKMGKTWLIPKGSLKPFDARKKQERGER